MKISLITPGFAGGGAENVFAMLANYWVSHGFQVDYLVCNMSGPMKKRLSSSVTVWDLGVKQIRPLRRILYARQIADYCKREKPQFILSTLPYCNQIVLLGRALFGLGDTRVIVREANSLVNIRKGGTFAVLVNFTMMRWLYPKADWVTANSQNTLNEIEHEIGIPRSKHALIRNPVELHTVNDLRARETKVILGCGRLIPQKDFETLVRAFAIVRKTHRCRLLIIGEGPERDNLEALARSLGLDDEIFALPGFVDSTWDYYLGADVFVLPSKWEGLPNVVLEALSYGLPVVATDCSGGTREIFTGNEKDHLVNVGAVGDMAAKIVNFLERPPEPSSMQSIVAGEYDVSTIAGLYEKLGSERTEEHLDV